MKYVIRKRKKEDCLNVANIVTIGWTYFKNINLSSKN